MADRRMFTKKVTDDDNFMSLSSSAQALYLHLSMSSDDDGFCNQVSASMFKAHASVQDLQALLEKRYIYQFESGVIVIKHWRMANALRKDRYTPTAFQEELAQLDLKDNGSYTMLSDDCTTIEPTTKRQDAYKKSSLPYSFDYMIKSAFWGKNCPICGFAMSTSVDDAGVVSDNRIPTIQHNIPISKGGEHELGNISVICKQCNVSVQDNPTDKLNADEVVKTWEEISGCRLVANCLPQDSIGKDRIDKDNINNIDNNKKYTRAFVKPTVEQVREYCKERNNDIDPETFVDFYESKGWMIGKNKMKDWKSAVRTWERSRKQAETKVETNKKIHNYDERDDYDFDELMKIATGGSK